MMNTVSQSLQATHVDTTHCSLVVVVVLPHIALGEKQLSGLVSFPIVKYYTIFLITPFVRHKRRMKVCWQTLNRSLLGKSVSIEMVDWFSIKNSLNNFTSLIYHLRFTWLFFLFCITDIWNCYEKHFRIHAEGPSPNFLVKQRMSEIED